MAATIQTVDSIEELMELHGIARTDIKKHFVAGGCELYYPYIGEDGRAHLGKAIIRKSKETA